MTTVLIAQSDADVRGVVHLVLREAGHVAVEADNLADAAMVLLISPQPYVVLLDAHLGGSYDASLRLLELVRDGALSRHTFILLSTESLSNLPPILQRLRAMLALPIVRMPFDLDELLEEIAQAVRRRLPLGWPELLVALRHADPLTRGAHN